MYPLKVKICCISSPAEAAMAIRHGAATLGLVGDMPSGPGVIDDDLIRNIVKTIPSSTDSFLLTSQTDAAGIIAHHQKVLTSSIQIVDYLPHNQFSIIREALPKIKLIQVIHVIDQASVDQAIQVAPLVDAILLDSGNPTLSIKELGGTGRTHNWELSKQIRRAIEIPLYLAGGLNHTNVREAIDTVQPHGIDLCSSVRTEGKLDEQKLATFFSAIK